MFFFTKLIILCKLIILKIIGAAISNKIWVNNPSTRLPIPYVDFFAAKGTKIVLTKIAKQLIIKISFS